MNFIKLFPLELISSFIWLLTGTLRKAAIDYVITLFRIHVIHNRATLYTRDIFDFIVEYTGPVGTLRRSPRDPADRR